LLGDVGLSLGLSVGEISELTAAGVFDVPTELWELGPGAVLAGLARRTNRDWPLRSFAEWADFAA
jgi:malonyl CoA-acyl carrier protein transacylase